MLFKSPTSIIWNKFKEDFYKLYVFFQVLVRAPIKCEADRTSEKSDYNGFNYENLSDKAIKATTRQLKEISDVLRLKLKRAYNLLCLFEK